MPILKTESSTTLLSNNVFCLRMKSERDNKIGCCTFRVLHTHSHNAIMFWGAFQFISMFPYFLGHSVYLRASGFWWSKEVAVYILTYIIVSSMMSEDWRWSGYGNVIILRRKLILSLLSDWRWLIDLTDLLEYKLGWLSVMGIDIDWTPVSK